MESAQSTIRQSKRFGTRRYGQFVSDLRQALIRQQTENIPALLDGLAGERCLSLVSQNSLRVLGAFFTSSEMAERIVAGFAVESWENHITFDPACGAADLLLPIAKRLDVKQTVSATLCSWNKRIFGCDLSHEFIEAARLRLMLLAVSRGAALDGAPPELARLLSNLMVADGLSESEPYSACTRIVMNPPYGRVPSGVRSWKEGAVTAAALFVERAAELSSPGTEIGALLPEVLRTGTSYKHWRNHVKCFVDQSEPQSIGQFSAHADVDVFIQHFIRRNVATKLEPGCDISEPKSTVGSYFSVAVGAVVPHRDPVEGPKLAFLHPKNAPLWGEVKRINETRRFNGRTFTPPFVVVRRTSRPGDRHRAVGTLILGTRKVAVENHLLVLSPNDGAVETCHSLMRVLRGKQTDEFLDLAMRCRHLTTSSVASVPWS